MVEVGGGQLDGMSSNVRAIMSAHCSVSATKTAAAPLEAVVEFVSTTSGSFSEDA